MENITGILRDAAVGHNYFQVLLSMKKQRLSDFAERILEEGVTP